LTKHGSPGPRVSISIREPIRSRSFAQHLHVLADVEQFRLERLTARERQQLARQSCRPRDGVRDRIDVAQPARLRQVRRRKQIDGGRITVSKLLKSCATPPVSCPSASSR